MTETVSTTEMHKNLEKPTLEQVTAFVTENRVDGVRVEEIRCGDGRPTPDQSNGAMRAFGEDFGMMLAIQGALWEKGGKDVDNEKLIDTYLKAVAGVRGENPRLFSHSDTHAQKDNGIGCGHAREASNPKNEDEYIYPKDKARSLFDAILKRPELDLQVLEGDHEEQAVLLVYSEKNSEGKRFSVNSKSKDVDDKSSYFVVDMNAIKEHFESVVPQIAAELEIDLNAEEAMKAYEVQQGESAQRLAFSKGLPAFNVHFDSEGNSRVEPVPAASE